MKKILKRITLLISTILTGFLLAAILLPYVYRDELIKALKDVANEKINATVDFTDAQISFFSSFPDIKIRVDNISIIGKDTFDGIVLYKAPETSVDINFTSLIGKNKVPEINYISSVNPEINIIALDSIHSNYLILRATSSDTVKYHLLLESYKISNGKLTYQDNALNLFIVAENITHEGNGDFTQDVFDLKTNTYIETIKIKYNGSDYLKNAKIDLNSIININFPELKYTLQKTQLKVNELDLSGEGFVQMKSEGIYNDIIFKTNSESFKSFMSILPNAFTKDFSSVKSSGSAAISGYVKGLYSPEKGMMPAFDVTIDVKNGYVKYPSYSQEIKNIQAGVNLKASRPDYKDLALNVNKLKLLIGNDPIEGDLMVENLTGNQRVSGKLNARLNLKNLKESYPIPDLNELSGLLKCDFSFNAVMSDVNKENYKAINFRGNGEANNIIYQSRGMPKIIVNQVLCTASPEKVLLTANQMKVGKSDLDFKLNMNNPLAIFSTHKSMYANIDAKSDFIDLNEWMVTDHKPEATKLPPSINNELLKTSGLSINLNAKKVLIRDKVIENLLLDGKMAANYIDVKRFSANIGESDININGSIVGVFDYLFANGFLDGAINLNSNRFNTNQFISSTPANSAKIDSIIRVPEQIRLSIKTSINELIYTNLILKDFKGNLDVKNQEVILSNLETKTLGGKLAMDGLYNTMDASKPDFSIKLDLSKIKFAEAISKLDMFKKAAPVAAFIDGIFNTTLVMKGKLGKNMMPDLGSLDASGLLETISGSIRGYNPMSELANIIGIKEIKEINLANTKNWFDIVQGYVELKEYSKKINSVDITISGKHGFGKEMDYNIDLVIPRELMKKNKILSVGEAGLSAIEKEALKYGVNINQGPFIFLHVKMTGTLKKPNFKITPKSSKDTDINEVIESKVQNLAKSVEDSIKNEIKKRETELRDTITKRANQELDKVKNKAENLTDKTIDSIKSKAKDVIIDKIDTLTKGVISDSLKQKAKDVLNNKTQSEVDKIKEKLKDFNPFKKKGNG